MERRFLLVYGSQTGQSQAVAEEIYEKALEHSFQPELHNISQTEKKFNVEKEKLLVLVISSTGDGEPPDTALKFWRRIRKKTLASNHLSNLRYTILGLGDSNYSNFCENPKNFDARFKQLGAKEFYPMGCADDAIGLEIVVEPWIEGLISALEHQFPKSSQNSLPVQINEADDNSSLQTCCSTKPVKTNSETETDNMNTHLEKMNVMQENFTKKLNLDSKKQEKEFSEVDDKQASSLMKSTPPISENIDQISEVDGDKHVSSLMKSTTPLVANIEQISEVDGVKQVSSLIKSIPPIEGQIVIPALSHPYLEIQFFQDEHIDLSSVSLQNGAELPSAATDVMMANLVDMTTLTTHDAVKTALEMQLEITASGVTFEPGDSFGIVCENNKDEVERLIKRLAISNVADCVCSLKLLEGTKKKNAAIPKFLPTRATIRHILNTCCDIRTPLKKGFIRMLTEYTTNTSERSRLQELCSKQGATQYTSFIREPNLSLLDILESFPSCCPPIERILEHLPRLLPRPYSISSSPLLSRNHLNFVFNIVEIPAASGRQYSRKGICTGWLSDLSLQDCQQKPTIPIYFRKNLRFRLQDDFSVPMILVGAGTGVAPFIGFLQHREAQMKSNKDLICAPIWLFFGCRHKNRDYLYRSELERYLFVGLLSNLLVSFSRDNEGSPNIPRYVQDNIRFHSGEVGSLVLEQKAVVYVCGDARNMSKDVNNTFIHIISEQQRITVKEAESVIMKLRKENRYLEDIWT